MMNPTQLKQEMVEEFMSALEEEDAISIRLLGRTLLRAAENRAGPPHTHIPTSAEIDLWKFTGPKHLF
jgi:hypothetical protein